MSYSDKLRHPKWQKKRLEILSRDNFRCRMCDDTEMELHVHHLEYNKNGNPWDVDNEYLITYCKVCHMLVEDFSKIDNINLLGVHRESYTSIDDMYFIASKFNSENLVYGIIYSEGDYKTVCSIEPDSLKKILNIFENGQDKDN